MNMQPGEQISPDLSRYQSKESINERMILVQVRVIELLDLSDDPNEAAQQYVVQGYNEKCRELMNTDKDVRRLLGENRLNEAGDLLVSLLQDWKQEKKWDA